MATFAKLRNSSQTDNHLGDKPKRDYLQKYEISIKWKETENTDPLT
jgi:hypothetical protein